MQANNEPEIKVNFNNAIAVFLFILLFTGIIAIGMICSCMINPSTIYLGELSASKKHFIQTYKNGNYDFMKNESVQLRLSIAFDKSALYIAGKAFQYFSSSCLMVVLNLLNALLGIMAYMKKQHKIMIITALLSFILGVYFLNQRVSLEESVRLLILSAFNTTYQYRNNVYQCSICYKSVSPLDNNNNYTLNMIALSLHAYECCGIKSYNDSIHDDEIPFTCCPRKSYAKADVAKSVQCQIAEVYPPCYDKLLRFMINKTMFYCIRLLLHILIIFNLWYALPTISWYFMQYVCPRNQTNDRKGLWEMIKTDIMLGHLKRGYSEASTLYHIPSLITCQYMSFPDDYTTLSFKDDIFEPIENRNSILSNNEIKKNFLGPNPKKISFDRNLKSPSPNENKKNLLLAQNNIKSSNNPNINPNVKTSLLNPDIRKPSLYQNGRKSTTGQQLKTAPSDQKVKNASLNQNMRNTSLYPAGKGSSLDPENRKSMLNKSILQNANKRSITSFNDVNKVPLKERMKVTSL